MYDEFVLKFVVKVKEFKVGNGFENGIMYGFLIYYKVIFKVEEYVWDVEKKGVKVLFGGNKFLDLGFNFYELMVILGMKVDMVMVLEEMFGLVVGLFLFDIEEEVVRIVNNIIVGLVGYFFLRDLERVYWVVEYLEVGMVGVNMGLIFDLVSLFGGVKESGFGREGSLYGIGEY